MTESIIKTLPSKNAGSFGYIRQRAKLPFPEMAQISKDGLVFWLDAGNPTSYTGSGTTWADLSGNGYDVTMQNSGSITYNSLGYFSTGSNGHFYRATGNVNIPDANDNYTILSWVRVPSWGSRGIVAIGPFGTGNATNAFRTDTSSEGAFYNYWWANDLLATGSNTFARPGCWYMASCSFDGTTRRIHTNTIQAASDTPTGHNVSTTEIRVAVTYSAEYLAGDIGVVMIYNRALENSELVQIYNIYRSRFGV